MMSSQCSGSDVSVPHLNIILPIGISFYTFHTITYIVDSYRGMIRPTRNFFEFAAYVSLFSQLVAGPIVRFRQIEEDLENLGTTRPHAMVVARRLVLRHRPRREGGRRRHAGGVRRSGAGPYHDLSSLATWMAMLAYTFQLYFDFSGYSTWRWASAICSAFGFRRTSTRRTRRSTRPTSGADGTSRYRRAFGTTSTSRSAAVDWGDGDLSQSHDHDADRRAVARRELDVRGLGRVSRRPARRVSTIRQVVGSDATGHAASRHVPLGPWRLGAVPVDQHDDDRWHTSRDC